MIVELVWEGFCWLLRSVIGRLPTWSVPDVWRGTGPGSVGFYVGKLGEWMGPFDNWLPGEVFVQCMQITIGARIVSFGGGIIMKLYRMVRGGG